VERWRTIGYVIPATTASLLAVALWMESAPLALGVLAGAIGATFLYSEWIRGRGEVLSDERTLRIDEMASRRTLQVLILALSFSVVGLGILSGNRPSWKSAYYLSSALLALVSILKLGLRWHYSRVM